ncbi:MAG TPA: hypothetical protein VGM88_27785 [Kofleriaceae bacterium]|jgi:hypothetical protein
MRAAIALLLVSSTALAAPPHTQVIGEGLTLVAAPHSDDFDGKIVLHEGKTWVVIASGLYASDWDELNVDKVHRTAQLMLESCELPQIHDYTFDDLHAMIAAEQGRLAYVKKRWADAEAGYLRATTLAPAELGYAFALARIRLARGNTDGAVSALRPLLAVGFISTYLALADDPDLHVLRTHPAIAAMTTPGDAHLAEGTHGAVLGYAPATDLLAVSETWSTWGVCSSGETLEIFNATTGTLYGEAMLRDQTYCEDDGSAATKAAFAKQDVANAKRAAEVSAMLAELGMKRVPTEFAGGDYPDADGKVKLRFPHAKLGIVIKDEIARLIQHDTVLVELQTFPRGSATFVPDARAIVLETQRAGHEGCEGTDPTMTSIIHLPPGVTP